MLFWVWYEEETDQTAIQCSRCKRVYRVIGKQDVAAMPEHLCFKDHIPGVETVLPNDHTQFLLEPSEDSEFPDEDLYY